MARSTLDKLGIPLRQNWRAPSAHPSLPSGYISHGRAQHEGGSPHSIHWYQYPGQETQMHGKHHYGSDTDWVPSWHEQRGKFLHEQVLEATFSNPEWLQEDPLGTSDCWSFSGPTTTRCLSLPPSFVSLFLLSLLFLFLPSAPFLLGPFLGPFPHMLPIGSFLHYNPPCISFSWDSVQGTFIQRFLLAHTVTHLTPTPPHILLTSMFTSHFPCTLTLKIEAAWSSKMFVSSHHTTCCNNPENHKFYAIKSVVSQVLYM